MIEIEQLKVIVCMLILVYACYLDIKERSVTNTLWVIMIALGIPFAFYNIIICGIPFLIAFFYSLAFTFALAYVFFKLNFFGGADAKCLIAISVLIPTTSLPDPFPFAITTLFNAAIISLTVPIFLFMRNMLHVRDKRQDFVTSFLGYTVPIADLANKRNLRLVHLYNEEDGEIKRKHIFGGVEIDEEIIEELKRYRDQGKIEGEILVTPELPFMLFITVGFFISLLYGNLIFHIMSYFIFA
jgi:preflagellin peptidase FlaK